MIHEEYESPELYKEIPVTTNLKDIQHYLLVLTHHFYIINHLAH